MVVDDGGQDRSGGGVEIVEFGGGPGGRVKMV